MRERTSKIYLRELKKEFKELLSPLKVEGFSLEDLKYSSVNEQEDAVPYFPPFYQNDKFSHFNPTDVIITLQLCGYEIKELKVSENSLYAKLIHSGERAYLFTMPDTFIIRFKAKDSEKKKEEEKNIESENKNKGEIEEIEIEFNGFSTLAFYRFSGSREFRVLRLPEINGIFIDHLLKRLNRWLSDDYKRYIF